MKISSLHPHPIEYYPYWIVATGGRDAQGERVLQEVSLPVCVGTIEGLSQQLDAIIVTSDLQGSVREADAEFLLGEKLPDFLSLLLDLEFPEINRTRTGVILCGDLYANLEKRGGLGDVKSVWRKFNEHFKWVVGVAGNHDDFGSTKTFEAFKHEAGIHCLHGQIREIDNISFAGISGIIGNPEKAHRVEEQEFLSMLKKLLLKQPSALILHQGPSVPGQNLEGNDEIRQIIERSPPNLIFCGHSHWDTALATLENGTQVLNVDARVLVLLNAIHVKNTLK